MLAIILQCLKLFAIVVSSVSGILATAFETKRQLPDGTKHINQFGITILVLIIVGSLVAGSIQIVENRRQANKDRQAAVDRAKDIARLSMIVRSSERLANPLQPLIWWGTIQFTLDDTPFLRPWIDRILAKVPGLVTFDDGPDRNIPEEKQAAEFLQRPSFYVGFLKQQTYDNQKEKLAVPIMADVPLLLEASSNADRSSIWRPGPNASAPPFYSRYRMRKIDGKLGLEQGFVVRNSPEAIRATGVISPLDLIDFVVVVETGRDAVASKLSLLFPTASGPMDIPLTSAPPILGFNRQIGSIDGKRLRQLLNLPPEDRESR